MKKIVRRPTGPFDIKIYCVKELTISAKNFIGFENIEDAISSSVKYCGFSEDNIGIYCTVGYFSEERIAIKIKIELKEQSEMCMAFLEFFESSLGNVMIYHKKIEYINVKK